MFSPQDGVQMATDLHTLLDRAQILGPYVLPATRSAACTCSPSPPATWARSPARRMRHPRQVRSMLDELGESATAMTHANALTDFAGKRLAVVTAGSGSNAAWLSAQDDLATLSTNAIHRVVSGATHASLLEAENDAGVSSRAIRDVIASVRTHQPLPTS